MLSVKSFEAIKVNFGIYLRYNNFEVLDFQVLDFEVLED